MAEAAPRPNSRPSLRQGATLASLCQSLAESLGGGVIVLDEAGRALSRGIAAGYDGTEVHRSVWPHGEHGVDVSQALRHSRQAGRSMVAYVHEGEQCRVVPVFGGNDVLGSVLLFHTRELDEISVHTFERSASIVGIVLLSQERSEAGRSRDVSILLRSLISLRQDPPAVLADRAERFGLDLSQPVSLVVIEMDDTKASYAARRLRALPELARAVLDEIDGAVVIVCGTTRAKDIVRTVASLVRPEFGSTCRGILSRPVTSPTEIPVLHATLRRALPVLARIGVQAQIVSQNEMALYSTLFETHDRSSLDSFLEATLGEVLTHDRRRGSELTATLLAYFDNNQNAKTTAQALGIHVNTVRQRLATIEELLGHWGQATRALEIHVALRMWSLTSGAS